MTRTKVNHEEAYAQALRDIFNILKEMSVGEKTSEMLESAWKTGFEFGLMSELTLEK